MHNNHEIVDLDDAVVMQDIFDHKVDQRNKFDKKDFEHLVRGSEAGAVTTVQYLCQEMQHMGNYNQYQ